MALYPRLARLAAAVFALGASCGVGSAADEVVWVYPRPYSLLTESPVAVYGYLTGAPQVDLDAKVVGADGAALPQRVTLNTFKGKVFSGSIPLTRGRNNVVVAGAVLPLYFRPDGDGAREGDFRRPVAHGKKIESCQCHTFNKGEIYLKQQVPELCLSCHKLGTQADRSAMKKTKRSQEVTADCLRCHEAHTSFEPKLLKSDDGLCSACHPGAAYAGYSHDKRFVPASCATCHDPHISAYPKMLRGEPADVCRKCHVEVVQPKKYPKSFHRPVEEGRCEDCHSPHPSGAPRLLKAALPGLCRGCHKASKERGHAGKLDGCAGCHEPHMANRPVLLTAAVTDRCVGCHPEKKAGADSHGALKEGCTTCHDPHNPEAKRDSRRVCGGCHPLKESPFQSAHGGLSMAASQDCILCHDPHAAKFPTLLKGTLHYPLKNGGCASCHVQKGETLELRYEGADNCLRCHGQITGTSVIKDTDKVHKPVSQIDCTACHNPHLGQRSSLLLEEPEVLCGWCHGTVLRGFPNLHGVFKEGGTCYTCHLPHISDFKPLLKRAEEELCRRCHEKSFPADKGSQRLLHGALTKGRCTGCHNPHGANEGRLLRQPKDALCASCHPEVVKAADGTALKYLHGPVGTGNCTACHDLGHRHVAVDDKFLKARGSKVCALCHDTKPDHVKGNYQAKMREVQNDCLVCHSPHGANNKLLMKGEK